MKDNSDIRSTDYESSETVIDEPTRDNIKRYITQGSEAIDKRIEELENKWDLEKTWELNAALLALGGLLLYTFKSKKWSFLSLTVSAFLIQHAVLTLYPPLPLLKKLGLRSRRQIDKEKFALKALRGDFNNIRNDIDKALEAVSKEKVRKPIGLLPNKPVE